MKNDSNLSRKNKFLILMPLVFVLIAAGLQGMASGDSVDTCVYCHTDNININFRLSLHHAARGMEYWYAAENGGLELMTGVPYGDFVHATAGCKNCHAGTCERCHKTTENPTEPAGASWQATCLVCHAREAAMANRETTQPALKDVHRDPAVVGTPMQCPDCHSTKEMHGDGTISCLSAKEPGAMDTKCENCHTELSPGAHHSVHGTGASAKLDCTACHQRRAVSCYNCHMDTAAPYGTGARVCKGQIDDWIFLTNYNGKVTSANMQTFVGGDSNNIIGSPDDKTALMFAPVHTHSIMNPGRACSDCHGTQIVQKIYNKRKLKLTWLEGETLMHQTGVIPVAAGTAYKFIAYDKDNTLTTGFTWTALSTTPLKPDLKQYNIAFGSPLTRAQMEKLKIWVGP
jgi:hypothetical protein